MSYEIVPTPQRGSRVAGNGQQHVVNSRRGGTATAARARRMADGTSGYNNLAGYEGLGFSLLNIVKPIASFIPGGSVITSGINLAQGLTPTNAKDPERLATAQSNLQKALAGDANAYLLLQQQAGLIPGYGSATQYGKDVAKAALAQYAAQKSAPPATTVATAPIVSPTTAATAAVATGFVPADVGTGGGGGGVNPLLLAGVALAAVMAIRGRR